MPHKVEAIEKHIHSCDIGNNTNMYKFTKKSNKKPKMPKDRDLFVFNNKTPNKSKSKSKSKFKSNNNIYNLKDARTHKGKNSKLKTKHQTKLSKSVFAKYHKITHSAKADARKRLRTFTTVSSRRNRLH